MFNLSKRWEMLLLQFAGITIVYCLRVNMSVAAQDMRDDLDWSENKKNLVLSAFYWGYALGQIPASRLAHMFGAKWLFGFSVLIPSMLTLLVPAACRTSFALAVVSRAVIGFFESATFPCVFHFYPFWIPTEEKPTMISAVSSGMYMGEIIGFGSSGILTTTAKFSIGGFTMGGWDMVFYVFGVAGVLWFPIWAMYAYETPEEHPTITQEEIDLIQKGKNYSKVASGSTKRATAGDRKVSYDPYVAIGEREKRNPLHSTAVGEDEEGVGSGGVSQSDQHQHQHQHRNLSVASVEGATASQLDNPDVEDELLDGDVPWGAIFTHPVTLTLFCQSFCFGWIGFTLLSEMPTYLTDVLGFDLESAGGLSVLPYLMLFIVTNTSGRVFNYLQDQKGWTTRDIRITAQFTSYILSAGGLVICGFLENVPAAFTFMIISQAALGICLCGFGCSFLDVAPNYAALLNTMSNTISAIAGIIGPLVVGILTTEYPGTTGWRIAFLLTAGLCVIALSLWYKYQCSDIVPELNRPVPRLDKKQHKQPLLYDDGKDEYLE